MAAPTEGQNIKNTLANGEPSTHGAKRTFAVASVDQPELTSETHSWQHQQQSWRACFTCRLVSMIKISGISRANHSSRLVVAHEKIASRCIHIESAILRSEFTFPGRWLEAAHENHRSHCLSDLRGPSATLGDFRAEEQRDVKGASICSPSPGNGATWLSNCEQAANSGDGRSAIIIGEIYWNGDGVSRTTRGHSLVENRDQQGRPDAAYLLGDEAYVRALLSPGNGKVDFAALDEAAHWVQKAVEVEPNSVARAQAQERLTEIDHLHKLTPGT